MHCPNCGTTTSTQQKYCRSCGLALEKIVQALGEQMPEQLDETVLQRKERLERLGVIALSVFGLGVLGMILYGIVYKVMIVQGRTFEGLGLLAFLTIVASGILAVILFAQANEASTKSSAAKLKSQLSKEPSAKLLTENHVQPLPSVTERTTELLAAERETPTSTRTREL